MVVGEIPELVDLLVVGGGPGGYVAAIRAAQLGREVVLVERDGDAGIGGVCLNVGCIPSKALIEVAAAAHKISALASAGLRGHCEVDLAVWQGWKRSVVADLTAGVRGLLRAAGVIVLAGELRFTRPNQAVVETTQGTAVFWEFTDVVIATGSRPAVLSQLVPDGVAVLDSSHLLEMTELPTRLAIVGAGYVGVELGTALAKLGSEVTIIEAGNRILPQSDEIVSRPVERQLRRLGVTVLTGASVETYDGTALQVLVAGERRAVESPQVLVAVGRTPNTDDLGLDRLGIGTDMCGLLAVGPDRRLSPHVAAIGDVTAGPALAHKASAEAHVAVEALSGRRVAFDPRAIPTIVFCDPEVASAGMTEQEAARAGLTPVKARFPLVASGRAATMDANNDGFVQLIADAESQVVVGVQVCGPHASELIAEGVLAVEMAATLDDFANTIHAHPTLSEAYPEAAYLALGRPIHVSTSPRTVR